MIIHYLKVALRNLWKYRTHSLISVLCLAVGITFYTVMNLFVNRYTGYRDLPDIERRVISILQASSRKNNDFRYTKVGVPSGTPTF